MNADYVHKDDVAKIVCMYEREIALLKRLQQPSQPSDGLKDSINALNAFVDSQKEQQPSQPDLQLQFLDDNNEWQNVLNGTKEEAEANGYQTRYIQKQKGGI